jgi:Tfp pilus assembly PilM family ATPase
VATATQPEVAVCGLPAEDVTALQTALLDRGIYPDRLELGSVATLGGLSDYLRRQSAAAPTLLLELGRTGTSSYIVSPRGFEAARTIPEGLDAMVPVVQKELGLRDLEAAKKLFYSNTFDFTGMGPALVRRLLRELQSSIGFFEVQTGQSVGCIICTHLPPELAWLEGTLANQLGIATLTPDLPAWLQAHHIGLGESLRHSPLSPRWFGLFCLIAQYHGAPENQK